MRRQSDMPPMMKKFEMIRINKRHIRLNMETAKSLRMAGGKLLQLRHSHSADNILLQRMHAYGGNHIVIQLIHSQSVDHIPYNQNILIVYAGF